MDWGTAFTSSEYAECCAQEEVKYHTITTSQTRANDQDVRIIQIIMSVLANLSMEILLQCHRHTNELKIF